MRAARETTRGAEKLILVDNDVVSDACPGRSLTVPGVIGDTPMTDLRDKLERLETLTAECELIAKLATDSRKREIYLQLAVEYRDLAGDTRRAIAIGDAA